MKLFYTEHDFFLSYALNFYCFVKSKLKLAPSFTLLLHENNFPVESEFGNASFFDKSFQKVLDYKNKNFKLVNKSCLEIQI